jgi:hypothetical protein
MSQDIQIQNQRNYEQQQTWLQQQRQEQERLDRINQQNNLIFELQKINYNLEQLHKDPIIFSSPPVVTPTVDFDR